MCRKLQFISLKVTSLKKDIGVERSQYVTHEASKSV